MEHNNLIDSEQEGLRTFHISSRALLRSVQTICLGFNENDGTVGIFIDI